MQLDLHVNEAFSVKRAFNASVKSIDSGEPVQSAQADMSRNFLIFVDFLHIKGLSYLRIHLIGKTENRKSKSKACKTFMSN